jgi:DNA polymerase-1
MTAILVDGHNMMHRAYHAVPYLSNKDGIPTNAIMGMVNMVLQDISTYNPKYMVVAFDRGGSDWRKKIYPEYKANRESKTDTTLKVQMQGTRRLLRAMGIRVCGLKGVEADDIIATLALKLSTRQGFLSVGRWAYTDSGSVYQYNLR